MASARFITLIALSVSLSSPIFGQQGARIFFSEVGPPVLSDPNDPLSPTIAPMPLEVGGVPTIYTGYGSHHSLHVWLQPNRPPQPAKIVSVALDIVSSNSSAGNALSFVQANPFNRNAEENRWQGVTHGMIGPIGSGNWVTGIRGLTITGPGINVRNAAQMQADLGRDANTGAFYLGRLDFAGTSGGGVQQTGLYFRNGSLKTVTSLGESVELQFGGNTVDPPYMGLVPGVGDPITPDLSLADAIIWSCTLGRPTPVSHAELVPYPGNNTNDVRLDHPAGGEFRSIKDNWSGAATLIAAPVDSSGDLTFYLDLADPNQSTAFVESLNQTAFGAYVASLVDFDGWNYDTNQPVSAEVAIRFFGEGQPGAGKRVAFQLEYGIDACHDGLVQLNAIGVGVPEPATWIGAVVGIATIGWRSRRVARRCQGDAGSKLLAKSTVF